MAKGLVGMVALGAASLILSSTHCGGTSNPVADSATETDGGVIQPDAGSSLPDSGSSPDAGMDAGLDAGTDAGVLPPDGGDDGGTDAGADAGGLPPVAPAPAGGTTALTLASDDAPDALAQDADTLYWVDRNPYCTGSAPCTLTIRSVSKSGGASVMLGSATGRSFALGTDDGSVYFAGPVGDQNCGRPTCNPVWKLYRVPKSGGDPVQLADGAGSPDQLAVAGGQVFLSGVLDGQAWSTYGILDVPTDGAPASTLAAAEHTRNVAEEGGTLLWTVSGGVRQVATGGGTPASLFEQSALGPTRLVADAERVYFLAQGSLWTAARAGGAPKMILQGTTQTPVSSVAVQGGQVYWTRGGCLGRVAPDGSEPKCLDDDVTIVRDVLADDAAIYAIRGTHIVRLAR